MTRRILTIIIAIVLAVGGTAAVLAYVNQADSRALAGQSPVTVLVATVQIPAGTVASTALQDGMLAREKVPAKSVPIDAVKQITPGISALVTSADVPSGELLLRPMLVTAVQATSGIAIPAGQVAVTIPMCIPAAVAGYIYPGAEVAIFDTVVTGSSQGSSSASTSCSSGSSSSSLSASGGTIRTRILLTRVTVLSTSQAPVSSSTTSGTALAANSTSNANSQGAVLVTLAVDQTDAERVITLARSGMPYMALLTKSSNVGPDKLVPPPFFPPFK